MSVQSTYLPLVINFSGDEVVMMITGEAPSGTRNGSAETALRKKVINDFTTAIINLWVKAFGIEFIQSSEVVQDKIRQLLVSYFNKSRAYGEKQTTALFCMD